MHSTLTNERVPGGICFAFSFDKVLSFQFVSSWETTANKRQTNERRKRTSICVFRKKKNAESVDAK